MLLPEVQSCLIFKHLSNVGRVGKDRHKALLLGVSSPDNVICHSWQQLQPVAQKVLLILCYKKSTH